LLALIAGLGGGCEFSSTLQGPIDGKQPDVPDSSEVVYTSCKALHNANPTLPDTTYVIDPDGDGPGMPLMVTCDMSTSGGGWTIVYVSGSPDQSTLSTYSFSAPRLLQDATDVLLAYRDPNFVSAPNYATFAMPAPWKAGAPFGYPGTDLQTMVSINDATPSLQTVRYGFDNFNNSCSDSWSISTKLGRICIVNTVAPYYNGFYTIGTDGCSESNRDYNYLTCSTQRRFSIAVH
jgi:hypothetical protein